jgi:hypothetical protein
VAVIRQSRVATEHPATVRATDNNLLRISTLRKAAQHVKFAASKISDDIFTGGREQR